MFNSLRWRLLAWHAGILVLTVAGFGVALYYQIRQARLTEIDAELQAAARSLEGALRGFPPPCLKEGPNHPGGRATVVSSRPRVHRVSRTIRSVLRLRHASRRSAAWNGCWSSRSRTPSARRGPGNGPVLRRLARQRPSPQGIKSALGNFSLGLRSTVRRGPGPHGGSPARSLPRSHCQRTTANAGAGRPIDPPRAERADWAGLATRADRHGCAGRRSDRRTAAVGPGGAADRRDEFHGGEHLRLEPRSPHRREGSGQRIGQAGGDPQRDVRPSGVRFRAAGSFHRRRLARAAHASLGHPLSRRVGPIPAAFPRRISGNAGDVRARLSTDEGHRRGTADAGAIRRRQAGAAPAVPRPGRAGGRRRVAARTSGDAEERPPPRPGYSAGDDGRHDPAGRR